MNNRIIIELEVTENGLNIVAADQVININTRANVQQDLFVSEVVDQNEKPRRKLTKPRKTAVKMTKELVTAAKFMLETGKSRADVMAVTAASEETIRRIEKGYYDNLL